MCYRPRSVVDPPAAISVRTSRSSAAFERLRTESIDRMGKRVAVEWGFGHEAQPPTAAERRDVIAYVRALARQREG